MTAREELAHLLGRLRSSERELVRRLAEEIAAEPGGARSELIAVLDDLTDQQVAQVLGVAQAMALPIEETLDSDSQVVTAEFAAEFRARVQAHHATHTTPMDRLSFESAFLAASRAAGRKTDEAPSKTTRFFDATIDDEQTALKTEGAKSLKADRLHISKLSEAAWIQDMRSGQMRRERTMEFLDAFLSAVDRIFVLRYYQADPAPHYELVEIPVSHFELVRSVPASAFKSDGPRIKIADEEGPIMEFRLDRSDSKITIGKIEKSRCIVHGDWRLVGLESSADAPHEEPT